MGRAQLVLAVVALCVGVVHSWDIAVSEADQLIFYDKGIKTNAVRLKYQNPAALAYDAVHNVMLYVNKRKHNDTICGYYMSSTRIECFIKRNGRNINSIAYDPRTEILFFTDTNERSINWISLKRGSYNHIYGNLLIKLDEGTPADIAIDGCKGNIYWINKDIHKKYYLEKARLDGSKREVSMFIHPLHTMGINPAERGIYYFYGCNTCDTKSLIRADLNFQEEFVLYFGSLGVLPEELTVTKDYIYWINSKGRFKTVWQLPKKTKRNEFEPMEISKFFADSILGITAKYEMNNQTMGLQDCNSLSNLLMPNITIAPGVEVNSERFDVNEIYCTGGICSVTDAKLPEYSCSAGFTGEMCELSVCDGYCFNNGKCSFNANNEPVCECQAGHIGDRCEASACLNYCLQGNCSINEGFPTCSCNAGYTGKRCEVYACYGYCLNDGQCSLDKEDKPVCQCFGDHEGTRCEVVKKNTLNVTNSSTYCSVQKNITLSDLVSGWQKPAAKISVNVDVLIV